MGWQDDLANLVGETVSNVPKAATSTWDAFSAPPTPSSPWQNALNEITGLNNPLHGVADALNPHIANITYNSPGDLLHVPGDLLGAGLTAMQGPAHLVQSGIGVAQVGAANLGLNLGLAKLVGGDPNLQRQLIDDYHTGGGQAVWNHVVQTEPLLGKAVVTLGTDPLTYVGLGLGEDAARALAAAAAHATNPVSKAGIMGARGILAGLQTMNDAPGALIADPARTLAGQIGQTQLWSKLHTPGDALDLSHAGGKLLDLSAQTKNSMFREQYHGLLEGWKNANDRIAADPALQAQLLSQHPSAVWTDQVKTQLPELLNPRLKQAFEAPAISDPNISMGEALKTNLADAQKDFSRVRQAAEAVLPGQKNAWARTTPINDKLNWAEKYDLANPPAPGEKPIATLIRKWADAGIDPLYGDPVDAAVNVEAKANAVSLGIKWQPSNMYNLFTAAFGEQALASGRFHFNNFMNGILQNAILGVQHVPSGGEILRGYEISRKGVYDPAGIAGVKNQLWSEQKLQPYGMSLPVETMERGLSQSLGRGRTNPSAGAELINKIPLPGAATVAKGYGRIMLWNRQFGQGIETTLRTTPFAQGLDEHMMQALPQIDQEIRQALPNVNVSLVQMRAPVNGQVAYGALSPDGVFKALVDAGAPEGQAIHFSRRVAQELNAGRDEGLALMRKAQFSYQKTNVDQWVSKVAPFMYWQSRAIPFYTEEALRHPTLALAYFREMNAANDDNTYAGMDGRAQGFVKFLNTYAGFTTLLNPQALWGVAKIYDQPDQYTPEGMTATGQVLQWYKNYGGGLYPWIDAMFNLAGTYGDTFEPDFFSIRQKALISAGLQFARAHAGLPPAGAPYENLMGQLRGGFSQFIADVGAPDWLAKPVYEKAGKSQSEITLDKAIENRVISNHVVDPTTGQTDLTNEQLNAIMTDANNPEYHRAYQDIANAGLLQQLGNFVLPVNIKIHDAQTDVRTAVTNTIYDHAKALGVEPWQLKPLAGDVEFAAAYKQATGRDWTPGAYDQTKLQNDLVNAVPEAKQFILDEHDYNALGNPSYQKYVALLNGSDPSTANVPDATRKQLALQWADEHGAMPDVNQAMAAQKLFRATHPEFDAFKQWQSGMFNIRNTLPGQSFAYYRDEVSKVNPDAAQYFRNLTATALRLFPNDPGKRQDYIEQQTSSANAWFMITGRAQMRSENIPIPAAPNTPPVDQWLVEHTPVAPNVPTPPWLANLGVNWSRE